MLWDGNRMADQVSTRLQNHSTPSHCECICNRIVFAFVLYLPFAVQVMISHHSHGHNHPNCHFHHKSGEGAGSYKTLCPSSTRAEVEEGGKNFKFKTNVFQSFQSFHFLCFYIHTMYFFSWLFCHLTFLNILEEFCFWYRKWRIPKSVKVY